MSPPASWAPCPLPKCILPALAFWPQEMLSLPRMPCCPKTSTPGSPEPYAKRYFSGGIKLRILNGEIILGPSRWAQCSHGVLMKGGRSREDRRYRRMALRTQEAASAREKIRKPTALEPAGPGPAIPHSRPVSVIAAFWAPGVPELLSVVLCHQVHGHLQQQR